MDLQKEREAFEKWAFQASEGWASFVKSHGDNYENDKLQFAWKAWQAAKAIPDGFVVVSQKDLLELTIAINAVDLATHTESKTNEVREMWQQVALKLMALGISQEQAND